MKILQINAVYKKLSTGRNVYEMNQNFWTQGHKAVAAYSVGTVEDPETEYLIGSTYGQKLHALLSRGLGLQGYFSTHSTRKLLAYMEEFAPDVVVLHNLHANYIHLPMLLRYLAKKDIPTVAVLHDCWFYTGKCCHYTVAGCYRWKEGCGKCPAKKKYNKSWLFDRTDKMLWDKNRLFHAIPRLAVVAVSQWLLNEAQQAPVFANAAEKIRIYNWIDTDQFRPVDGSGIRKELGLENKKIVLGVAGSWDNSKGLYTALELAKQLGTQEQLVLVGKMAAGIQLPQNVTHIPRTDNVERLVELYSAADVFLQPSLEETFGKVSAEALACGTPVVCFNSTANPEVVGDGCGSVVQPGDLQGLVEAVRRHLQQGKSEISATCRAFAQAHFNSQQNIGQYMNLFERLVQAKSGEIHK